MCNFKIGQEVIVINPVNDKSFPYKKGDIVRVLALAYPKCSCEFVVVDIGLKGSVSNGEKALCYNCKCPDVSDGIWWLNNNRFAPLQTDSEEADMTEALLEVLERELFQV